MFGPTTRPRWIALGTSVALAFGAGGVLTSSASGITVSSFVPVAPCRLIDTRPAPETVGPRATSLGANETYVAAVWGSNGNCTIPSGATGVSMNVAIINPTAPSYLTVFPADASPRPLAANLNWVTGQAPTPNAVTASLSSDGTLGLYNLTGTVDLVVDVNGYYVPAASGTGPVGPTGPAGVAGAQGLAAWDVIPSGTTVTGVQYIDEYVKAGGRIVVPLPARAPTPLVSASVNFDADLEPSTIDDDAACAGSIGNPTAPPGKVCLYWFVLYSAPSWSGGAPAYLADRAFTVNWSKATGEDQVILQFTWAYTAP